MESLEFFEIQGESSKNELIKWLNKSINEYHLKLNQFYGDLFDINLIVKAAEKGLLTNDVPCRIICRGHLFICTWFESTCF